MMMVMMVGAHTVSHTLSPPTPARKGPVASSSSSSLTATTIRERLMTGCKARLCLSDSCTRPAAAAQ